MILNGREQLLTIREIVEQYKVSRITLWRHHKQGILPTVERQGRVYVSASFVRKNYQKRTTTNTEQ